MLRRMEKSGLVIRSQSEDGKHNEISLTRQGAELCEALSQDMVGEPERIFAGLSDEDRLAARRIFLKISENLQNFATNG